MLLALGPGGVEAAALPITTASGARAIVFVIAG